MSETSEPAEHRACADGTPESAGERSAESARRRRRAEIFGEVLPESTSDDVGTDGTEDQWYLENRPPHH